ncbi:MAG: DNA processing protein [Crocinitomix sp.]
MTIISSKVVFLSVEENIYKIALPLLQGIGIVNTKTLIAYAGGAKAVFDLSEEAMAKICEISINKIRKFNRRAALARAAEEIIFMQKNSVQLHYYQDEDYPAALKFCEDSPIVLYSKGNVNFKQQNVSIVGTRKATSYGIKITKQFVKDLAPRGVQIVSGLAHGIDKTAHEAAITNDLSTIAVLGHGLDFIYPAANKQLALLMQEKGGLVTEYISGTRGEPGNFPQRNRIVAGLSEATVVIESAISGGSLITANLAFGYGRQVFAFPGNIDRGNSAGCNNLIQRDTAKLITAAEDMIIALEWEELDADVHVDQTNLFEGHTVDEDRIIKVLQSANKATHIDDLAKGAKMTASELSLHLFNLEMRGSLQSLPGKMYQLV